jgi:hypothetical protein
LDSLSLIHKGRDYYCSFAVPGTDPDIQLMLNGDLRNEGRKIKEIKEGIIKRFLLGCLLSHVNSKDFGSGKGLCCYKIKTT